MNVLNIQILHCIVLETIIVNAVKRGTVLCIMVQSTSN
jgi:hypothetical protein